MKLKTKTSLNFHLIKNKKKEKGQLNGGSKNRIQKEKNKNFSKKKNKSFANNPNTNRNKDNIKSNHEKKIISNILNIEDSSTNCFSGKNKKKIIPRIIYNINEKKDKDNLIIPFLIQKENDTESLFINFKLGEKDSYTESTLRSDIEYNNYKKESKKIINMKSSYNKNNKNKNKSKNKNKINYDYCYVDNSIGQNESDSLEIYDFNDKNNEDYILNNLSVLSCSKSWKEKSSFNVDDFNDEDINGNKNINKIKIFNTKNNNVGLSSNNNNINNNNININKNTFIKNKFNFRHNYKY